MDFVFLMMKGSSILAVDVCDLEGGDLTIEQAAEQLAKEITENTKERPTAYAVIGCSDHNVWLLQQATRIKGEKA